MKTRNIDSDLALAILGLLSLRPASGYDLRKVFLTTAIKAFSASPGAVYPALRRLEKDGLIEGAVERKHALRPRMIFTLTRKGRDTLVATLTKPVTREDVIRRLDGLLLRFSFMSGLIGEAETLAFLAVLAAETQGYLNELEEEYRRSAPGMPFSSRAALEQGVETYRVTARWAGKTLKELKKDLSSKGASK